MPVSIHLQNDIEPVFQGILISRLQSGAIAHVERMGKDFGRGGPSLGLGLVPGSVIHHQNDRFRDFLLNSPDNGLDFLFLVEGGNDG